MNGQITMFDELVQDPEERPFIGTEVVFYYEEKKYDAVVVKHLGCDFVYIEFLDKRPGDDNPNIYHGKGWHISVRGYKKDWDYK